MHAFRTYIFAEAYTEEVFCWFVEKRVESGKLPQKRAGEMSGCYENIVVKALKTRRCQNSDIKEEPGTKVNGPPR